MAMSLRFGSGSFVPRPNARCNSVRSGGPVASGSNPVGPAGPAAPGMQPVAANGLYPIHVVGLVAASIMPLFGMAKSVRDMEIIVHSNVLEQVAANAKNAVESVVGKKDTVQRKEWNKATTASALAGSAAVIAYTIYKEINSQGPKTTKTTKAKTIANSPKVTVTKKTDTTVTKA